jgi:NAD dependent epimerase/dehydratase family
MFLATASLLVHRGVPNVRPRSDTNRLTNGSYSRRDCIVRFSPKCPFPPRTFVFPDGLQRALASTKPRNCMRVLVTGGRGKVGSYAVNALVAAGHRVFVTDLGAPRYGMRRIGEPSYSRADLTDYGQNAPTLARMQAGSTSTKPAVFSDGIQSAPGAITFRTSTCRTH